MISENPLEGYELLQQYNKERQEMEQLPLSIRNLQLILNTKNPSKREMLMVISTYNYEVSNTATCVVPEELGWFFQSLRQMMFSYCVAKRYYIQAGVIENIEPMESIPEDLLEDGEYYFDNYGDMYYYESGTFKEVALTLDDFKRDDFREIPVQAFSACKKLTLLRCHE